MENPSGNKDYEGRVRSVEHVDGNWASFVYGDLSDSLRPMIHFNESLLPSLEKYGLKKCESFHLSLSKLFVIQYEDIQSLRKELGDITVHYPHLKLALPQGSPWLKVFVNEEGTRTFLGIPLSDPNQVLPNLQEGIDSVLEERDLPTFYSSPEYHVSLLWTLGDRSKELELKLTQLQNTLFNLNAPNELHLSKLKLKTGNKIFDLPLSNY